MPNISSSGNFKVYHIQLSGRHKIKCFEIQINYFHQFQTSFSWWNISSSRPNSQPQVHFFYITIFLSYIHTWKSFQKSNKAKKFHLQYSLRCGRYITCMTIQELCMVLCGLPPPPSLSLGTIHRVRQQFLWGRYLANGWGCQKSWNKC